MSSSTSSNRSRPTNAVRLDKEVDILTHHEYFRELLKSILKPRNFLLVGLITFFVCSSYIPAVITPRSNVVEGPSIDNSNTLCQLQDTDLTSFQERREVLIVSINEAKQRLKELRPKVAELHESTEELVRIQESNKLDHQQQLNDMRHTLASVRDAIAALKHRQGEIANSMDAIEVSVKSLSEQQNLIALESVRTGETLHEGYIMTNSIKRTFEDIAALRERVSNVKQQQMDLLSLRSAIKSIKDSLNSIRGRTAYMQSVESKMDEINKIVASLQCPPLPDTRSLVATALSNRSLPQPCTFDPNKIQLELKDAVTKEVKDQWSNIVPAPPECDNKEPVCDCESEVKEMDLDTMFNALPDYAQRAAGARVLIRKSSPTYFPSNLRFDRKVKEVLEFVGMDSLNNYVPVLSGKSVYNMLGVNYGVGRYEDAISHGLTLGSCWPMQGSKGQLAVELASEVYIHSISIDHVPRNEAINMESALRDFEVYGRSSSEANDRLLLQGTYNISNDKYVQNFPVSSKGTGRFRKFNEVTLKILSNHGNSDYTCLYRLRVHGLHAL